ncbi:MAG: acetylxylan esterase [Ferruginibacter sp.]|nr:acetylxylan esterase [Ferruginibacter sp.]
MIKKILYSVCCFLATVCLFAQEKTDPNFHLYLLVGQSNMAGRAAPDSISKIVDPHVWMLDKNNEWVPATDPVHFDKPNVAGIGPAISFAKAMIGNDKKINIGLIPCAWGGSPIRVWQQDSVYLETAHPYDDAVKRTKIAMQKGVLKGILWHQGESDNNPAGAVVYMDKLKTLIKHFRSEFNNPNLPFVAGEIGYFGKTDLVNKVIDSLPENVSHTAVVSAKGLTDKGDKTHFDAASARELGIRYAEAMKKLK